MNRRLGIIGAVAVAIVLSTLGVLYYLGGKEGGAGGFLDQVGRGFSTVTGTVTGGTAGMQDELTGDFAFRRLEVDTTKAKAEACLVFTQKLDASGRTHYEDYLSIDPQTRVAVHVVDNRLCIAGFDFNATYNVTLKKGLPSGTSALKLIEDETIPVELRDKPAIVRFSGGVVLPRENLEGVPVTTVNVDKLNLKIIRVGDRLLSQIESGVVDQTTMYDWDTAQLQDAQGSVVWTGTMDVANVKNDSVVTLIPIRDILKSDKPGAYVLLASDAAKKKDSDEGYSSEELAAQWVIASDIAVTSFQGAGGLAAFTRSYSTARPIGGVKLTLIARNNNILQTVTTGDNGRADFDAGWFKGTGGDEPVVVMAYGAGGDFSFLDLRRPAFDLTDRGVGGRDTPGPVDAYLYTERGVYRPGETVHAVSMLRDRVGAAVKAPLTLIATRPDGLEVARTTVPGDALAAGSARWDVTLRETAPHGRWQIAAYIDPKASPVGRVQFDVADFIPQRLKIALTPVEKVLAPNSGLHVKVESRFLYGAPASGLSGDGEARITTDPQPFEAYKDFQFGRVDDTFADVLVALTVPESDAAGITEVSGTIGDLAETTLPLKAQIKVSIHEPGGRTTDKSVEVPVRTRNVFIGIRPDFDGGSVAENVKAGFEAVAVDGNGKRIALNGLTVSWVREVTSYQWYQDNGSWKYQSTTRDRLITSGSMNIAAGAPLKLAQSMPWGTYRLTITDTKSGAATSYRFYSGWAASASGDRPDRIPVAANKPSYRVGETAHITIKPVSDGQALVVVAGDNVFESHVIDAPASGASIDIPVSADWGPGAYVLVTHYRALNQATGREPVRAIGVVWLGLDNSPRTLQTLIGGPQKITPRQRLVIPVTVKGLEGDESAYVTLAAVDEGILQLTDFASPDPNTYYFGKRRLGVGMRDDYGRLIKAEKGAVGSLKFGGDSFGGRPLAVVPTRTVALFSGIVKLGAGGMAQIPIEVPDFNGELRLMAVAWTDKKLGHADRPLTVRDPVVADVVLPRFLAPGDRALAALNMNNVEGGNGSYTATITTSGPVGLDAGAPQTVITRPLNRGQRLLVPVVLTGRGLGIATVKLAVAGPNGFKVNHDWQIQVRAPQLDIASQDIQVLASQQSYFANGALVANLVPSTVNVGLNVSSNHGYSDVPGLLRWLDKYPFGCIEQTTSRAMPLLYFNDLAQLAGLPKDAALRQRIQDAIDNVLDMQNYGGDFGMWGPGSSADPFISAFALDFLHQAKAKNFVVPNDGLTRGDNWARRTAASDSFDDAERAYAFYVLARAGKVNLSDLRYFSDMRGSEWNNAIAAALTGAAAAQAGDKARAAYAFNRAREILMAAKPETYTTDNYGSLVRDLAATTGLALEGGSPQLVPALMKRTNDVDMRLNITTTQEKAWMLRTAYELSKEREPLKILVNGKPATLIRNAVRLSPSIGWLNSGITLTNKGDAAVWRSTSVQGTPSAPLPATATGLTLTKTVWTPSGAPADLATLKQNDRVVVVLEGQMTNNFYRELAALDLLPAGLEIEAPISGDEGKAYPFLGSLTATNVQESRDDRYVAAFNIGSSYQATIKPGDPIPPPPSFKLAYIARATVPGTFAMPAGVVEDMYAPEIMGRTTMGTVTVGQ